MLDLVRLESLSLPARSPVFADLFRDSSSFPRDGVLTPTLTLADVNADAFKELLRYLYSGRGMT